MQKQLIRGLTALAKLDENHSLTQDLKEAFLLLSVANFELKPNLNNDLHYLCSPKDQGHTVAPLFIFFLPRPTLTNKVKNVKCTPVVTEISGPNHISGAISVLFHTVVSNQNLKEM